MSRTYTKDEMREIFLHSMKQRCAYWAKCDLSGEEFVFEDETEYRLEGLLFSFMTIIDGCTDLPAIDLSFSPHEDDKQYHIDNGDDYYPDGIIFNDDIMLHEILRK